MEEMEVKKRNEADEELINRLKEENEKLKEELKEEEIKVKTIRDKLYGRITLTKKHMDIIIGVLVAILLIVLVISAIL